MRIVGIDPGLATGGLVLLEAEPERVLGALSLRTRPQRERDSDPHADSDFQQAVRRAEQWAEQAGEQVLRWHGEAALDLVVVESFVDLPSHAGRGFRSRRWSAPLTIGLLHPRLQEVVGADKLRYQNPRVLAHMREEIAQLEAGQPLVEGQQLLRNGHLIRAWAHASWALERAG